MKTDADYSIQMEIDRKATAIFENALPEGWQKFIVTPDYYVDYQLETRHERALTGLRVCIQQKGQENVKITPKGATFNKLQKKHVRYWVNKCRMPVFLVVIDVTTEKAYWIFIQQYVLSKFGKNKKQKLRGSGDITVHLPLNQTMDDMSAFWAAMEQAHNYMTDMRPGSIQAAMKREKDRLEAYDRRIQVITSATDGVCLHELRPREPITVTVTFKGDEEKVNQLVSDFYGKGLPIALKPEDIEVIGSPLLQAIFKQELTLQQRTILDVDLRLMQKQPDGTIVERFFFRPATIEGGYEEYRLNASLAQSLIVVTGKHQIGRPLQVKLNYSLKAWTGLPILNLPYFEQARALFKGLADGNPITLDCSYLGSAVFGGVFTLGHQNSWAMMGLFVETLAKARELAKHFNVDPIFPGDFDGEQLEGINCLYATAMFGTRPASQVILTIGVSEMSPAEKNPESPHDNCLRISLPEMAANIFGQSFRVPPRKIQFTNAKAILPNGGDLAQEVLKPLTKPIHVQWVGTPNSEISVEPIPAGQDEDGSGIKFRYD